MKNKCVAVLASLIGVTALGATPALASDTTFSGQATGLKATVLGLTIPPISDTGPLPSGGGNQEASLFSASVPGILTAEVFHSSTIGQGHRSRSDASDADRNLTVGANRHA